MTTKKDKQEQRKLKSAASLDEFLGKLKELALEIPAILIAVGLNDASVEGVVFSEEGDYVDGQPLGDGVYVILGLGNIPHALESGVHLLPKNSRAKEPTP